MNTYDFVIYTFLTLILLYVIIKIRKNMNEDFNDEYEQNYSTHYDISKHKCHQDHHSHHNHHMHHEHHNHHGHYGYKNLDKFPENDFKFGKKEMMGILDTDELMKFENNKNIESFDGSIDGGNIFHNKKKCTIDTTDNDADIYIRKRLLAGNDDYNKKYLDNDLKKYRDNHFAFRNNVWQTSKDVDMVDKINDMYFSGDYDLTRNRKGTRISDLFNDLTKNDDKIEQTCISNMTSEKGIDRIMNQKAKKINGHNGNMLSDDLWFYKQEKIMNGGDFYDGIKPFEGNCSVNQAI